MRNSEIYFYDEYKPKRNKSLLILSAITVLLFSAAIFTFFYFFIFSAVSPEVSGENTGVFIYLLIAGLNLLIGSLGCFLILMNKFLKIEKEYWDAKIRLGETLYLAERVLRKRESRVLFQLMEHDQDFARVKQLDDEDNPEYDDEDNPEYMEIIARKKENMLKNYFYVNFTKARIYDSIIDFFRGSRW